MAPLWRARDLEPRPYGGSYDHLYLDIYPPELQPRSALHIFRRQLLRSDADDGTLETSVPLPLPGAPAHAPLVYVTMGTAVNDPEPLRVILAALRGLDVRALVTVGPELDPAVVGPPPPQVRVERYVPQTLVLPHCDLVVSHAGSGTVLATVAAGLPQLCLPQGADQFLNAAAVAAAGVGISLMPGEAGRTACTAASPASWTTGPSATPLAASGRPSRRCRRPTMSPRFWRRCRSIGPTPSDISPEVPRPHHRTAVAVVPG